MRGLAIVRDTNKADHNPAFQAKGKERRSVRFSELQVGDVFKAYGDKYQKLPAFATVELPEANAINTVAWRAAFFGPTVAVQFVRRARLMGPFGHLEDRTRSSNGRSKGQHV